MPTSELGPDRATESVRSALSDLESAMFKSGIDIPGLSLFTLAHFPRRYRHLENEM
jgi:hypothetical protein